MTQIGHLRICPYCGMVRDDYSHPHSHVLLMGIDGAETPSRGSKSSVLLNLGGGFFFSFSSDMNYKKYEGCRGIGRFYLYDWTRSFLVASVRQYGRKGSGRFIFGFARRQRR